MNEAELLARAEVYMGAMDDIVAAVLADLGESPEALRGAEVITSTACLLISTLVDPQSDDHQMAEMAAVATTLGHLVRRLDTRLREVRP
jgi:predicted regulator of Ras-like GTPase activity (Roadblock/LC7/MglB family)